MSLLAGRVIQIKGEKAIVDVDGNLKEALLSYVKDVKPGDYVKIYYGIVLEKVTQEEAYETLARCSYNKKARIEMSFMVSNRRF